jgi:LacI family transcriptional regulator
MATAPSKPDGKHRPTIAMVAKQAGVAVSTVSRYLNGGYVSQAVRARLRLVTNQLGYVPSVTARNLSTGRQGCIGVVVGNSQDLWFTQLLAGIEEELSERHTSLMLASLRLRGHYDASTVFNWLSEHRVDGLIFARSFRKERPLLAAAIEEQLPVVVVAPDEPVAQSQVVRCDNRTGGILVADHLASLGHTRVAFAGGPFESVDSRDRLEGLREGLGARGITLHPDHVSFCGSYEASAGAEFARTFLKQKPDVTALVLGNDALALGFMRIALQRGVRIPGDLSVVGFDGVPEGARVWPGLTSVTQPMRDMGRTACRKLLLRIAEPAVELDTVEYQMELIVRESTGRAGGQNGA